MQLWHNVPQKEMRNKKENQKWKEINHLHIFNDEVLTTETRAKINNSNKTPLVRQKEIELKKITTVMQHLNFQDFNKI